jgi:hypothetical protein
MVRSICVLFVADYGFSGFREIGTAGATWDRVAVMDMLIRTTAQFVDREKHD